MVKRLQINLHSLVVGSAILLGLVLLVSGTGKRVFCGPLPALGGNSFGALFAARLIAKDYGCLMSSCPS